MAIGIGVFTNTFWCFIVTRFLKKFDILCFISFFLIAVTSLAVLLKQKLSLASIILYLSMCTFFGDIYWQGIEIN
jgi:hypothetical protein